MSGRAPDKKGLIIASHPFKGVEFARFKGLEFETVKVPHGTQTHKRERPLAWKVLAALGITHFLSRLV